MIIVAVILGAVTVLAARSFIESERGGSEFDGLVVEQVETTTIVIATVPLKFGDEITTDQLKEVEWPADLQPEGSFTSISEIIGKERRVTLRSIDTNEPVVKSKISGFGFRATLSQIIGEGKRAVTIRVNDVASVGGFVLPGDEVDVILSYQDGDKVLDSISKIILQNVRVLAIDQIADEAQEGAIVGKAATLEVSPEEAQKIALSSKIGTLSLALRRISDLEPESDRQTDVVMVKDLKPAGGDVIAPVSKPKSSSTRTYWKRPVVEAKKPEPTPAEMLITRGTERTSESVDRELEAELAGAAYPQKTDAMSELTGSVKTGISQTTKIVSTVVGQ